MTVPQWPARVAALLAAGAGIALIAALFPASASVAVPTQDSITGITAGSPPTETGLLTISLTASSPITSLSAQLCATGTGAPCMTFSSWYPQVPGTQPGGKWTIGSPIPTGTGPGELPLGDYTVAVTASDQGGTTVANIPAGTLGLLIEPSLTFTTQPVTVDWFNRSVTFSGSVRGRFPDGITGPVPGAVVTISPQSGDSGFTATAGSDGSYSATQQVTEGNWQASVTGGPGVDATANTLQQLSLAITPDEVKLTAAAAKPAVNYRRSDIVSGNVLYHSGSIWRPLGDYQVTLLGAQPNDSATATTDANGHYSAVLKSLTNSDQWTVSAGLNSAWFNGASKPVNITVNWPAAITRVSERLSPSGVLSASGCIVYKVPNGQNDQSTQPLWVDYARGPRGPWRVLGKMPASWNGVQMCPAAGANWTGQFPVRLANAWYREQIMAAPGIEPTTTKPVHLWKIPTRIVRFHVSSRHVAVGGSLTIKGVLQQYAKHWLALAHQLVWIVLQPNGSQTWYYIRMPRTTASGHFSATFADPGSATWSALFLGGKNYFASAAPKVYVSVG
jgi:hypothetical protein